MRSIIKTSGRKLGVEISHFRPPEQRRAQLLKAHAVDLVLDVGANIGQYAQSLRSNGYAGRIVSFEPLLSAFETLESESNSDPLWEARRAALGNSSGEATLRIGKESTTSSLLPVARRHLDALAKSVQQESESVPLARLDQMDISLGKRPWLKLDVQGSELGALEGASGLLHQVTLIECELSIVPLYQGQPLLIDILNYLQNHGFDLVALEPGFYDPENGAHLQFDGFFLRSPQG